jgi:phage terminase large subunit GpA-like protein
MLDTYSDFADARAVLKSAFSMGLKPDPTLSVWEWADQNRILTTETSAEVGKWRTSRTPYLKEIMECLSINNAITEIVLMKGTQIGGTEVGLNWVGYIIDHAPGPLMIVWPRDADAKTNSNIRLQPMIDNCPSVKGKVSEKKSRDSKNTLLEKKFTGGHLRITGANSGPGLRSLPRRYLLLDETDAYPIDVDGEGDPIALAEKRTKTFASKKKIFKLSSPKLKINSKIESAYLASDQRQYFVPCPHCHYKQVLKFKNLIYENEGEVLKDYNVKYLCANQECGVLIEEKHKTWMLENGEWVAKNPGAKNGKVAGFHLSALYSPLGWHSWSDIVEEWLGANYPQVDTEKLKTFVNTTLAETWAEKGDAPDFARLWERREPYEVRTVPKGAVFLTAGVDVQKDRFEVEVCGWGRKKVSWSIDYIVIPGDTADVETWKKLDELLEQTFIYSVEGKTLEVPIKFMLIDSGYNSDMVYDYCRKKPRNRVAPTKGSDSLQSIVGLPHAVDITKKGKKRRRGVNLWPVGASVAKTRLYGWLRLDATGYTENDPPGYCHFPNYSKEYFKQLTAEELRTVRKKTGQAKYEWHRLRRNEALDCRVLNMAAAEIIGISRFKEPTWQRYEANMGRPLANKPKTEPGATDFWD